MVKLRICRSVRSIWIKFDAFWGGVQGSCGDRISGVPWPFGPRVVQVHVGSGVFAAWGKFSLRLFSLRSRNAGWNKTADKEDCELQAIINYQVGSMSGWVPRRSYADCPPYGVYSWVFGDICSDTERLCSELVVCHNRAVMLPMPLGRCDM